MEETKSKKKVDDGKVLLGIIETEKKVVPEIKSKFGLTFSREQAEYGYYYDEKQKKRVFGIVGKKNVYDEIQSHSNETDMKYIKQLLLDGGAPELTPDMYADVSHISPDLLDNLLKADYAKSCFDTLPIKIKEKYGNDFSRFASEFKFEDFDELYKQFTNPTKNSIVEKPIKEVKESEEI